ncbi:YCF48-related protein [Maribacter sp. BPC-D8]|uniref:WD40/YVTN/BNR-like repeat-containing protein n=1 Tax=Maribacter sp. BPC-D8 TaxID=3053613 RepID=UPI002B48EB75|nr:YCF48-related protein [Maribacter sp. BPC-D8]WRI31521.1 YCF48-related protein [Maribacter sp. BPC-D8]
MNKIKRLILVLILILISCKGQNNQEEKPLTGFNKVELVLDNEFITKDTITQKSISFLNSTTKQEVSVLHHIEETGFHMYNGMSFKNKDVGVIVGGAGLITRITKDGGKTWLENRFSRFGNPFYSVAFSDNSIFVVGDSEYIFTTPDLGENWSAFNTEELFEKRGYFTPKYYKTRFVNGKIGFVVGSGYISGEDGGFSVILKSVDAGKTWTNIEHKGLEKETEGISDFVAFSEKEIIVVTFSGRSYKSTDGGITWKLLFETDGEDFVNLNSIAFLNQNTGLIGGLGGDLFYNDNSGLDWRKIDMPKDGDGYKANISDIIFTKESALITTSISSDYYRDTFVYELNIDGTNCRPFLTSDNEEVLFSGESFGIQAIDDEVLILDRDNLYKTKTSNN